MKERPILFSASMVRRLLAGTKTQTRRTFKVAPKVASESTLANLERRCGAPSLHLGEGGHGGMVFSDADGGRTSVPLRCPYGVPGDRLRVREAWGLHAFGDETDWERGSVSGCTEDGIRARYKLTYRADWGPLQEGCFWRPGIHMPRWASRLTLEVTGVRVERLQTITDDDAQAEGARRFDDIPDPHPYKQGARWSMEEPASTEDCLGSARFAFANLWNKINGEKSWDENPWVWAVSFKRVSA